MDRFISFNHYIFVHFILCVYGIGDFCGVDIYLAALPHCVNFFGYIFGISADRFRFLFYLVAV